MSAELKIVDPECRGKTWSDIEITLPADFRLDSGETLSQPRIGVRVYGPLDKPVIAIAGGISAGRGVADADGEKGWWREYVNKGRAVDLNTYTVIGFDFLPNADEAARTMSTLDQARALAHALDILNIETLDCFIGSSYGGMAALAFAVEFPERVNSLVVISAADKPHPFGTAIRGVQRRIVEFANEAGNPDEGVALARQLAMISYRTPGEFDARFEHSPGASAGDPYSVCDYLISRGRAFGMDAGRYVTLSDSIDRHLVDLSKVKARALFIAANGDQITPPSDLRRCAKAIRGARYVEVFSQYGHDAFLKEAAAIGPFIEQFLQENGK